MVLGAENSVLTKICTYVFSLFSSVVGQVGTVMNDGSIKSLELPFNFFWGPSVWAGAFLCVAFIRLIGLKALLTDFLSCSGLGFLAPKNTDGLGTLGVGCVWVEAVGLGVAVVDGPPKLGIKVAALGLGLNSNAFAFILRPIDAGDMDFGAIGICAAAGPVGTV